MMRKEEREERNLKSYHNPKRFQFLREEKMSVSEEVGFPFFPMQEAGGWGWMGRKEEGASSSKIIFRKATKCHPEKKRILKRQHSLLSVFDTSLIGSGGDLWWGKKLRVSFILLSRLLQR
jgi:hypothetical protein